MAEAALLTGPLEPTNEPYAIAKIAGIKLCESYNHQHGPDYRSVMPTNLYGPGAGRPGGEGRRGEAGRRLGARWRGARWLGARWLGARRRGTKGRGREEARGEVARGRPRCVAVKHLRLNHRWPVWPRRRLGQLRELRQ